MRDQIEGLNDHVVFFNRIPKSGSEVLVVLIQWIQGYNTFRHIRLKGSRTSLNQTEQESLVSEIENKARLEAVPVIFDRNVYFTNFTKFGKQSPTFINLIRNPVELIVSSFQYQAKLKVNSKTFNISECIINNFYICQLNNYIKNNEINFAIPYFCGHNEKCGLLNNKWALNQAKLNVEKYFPVIGVLDELNATLEVFENKLPTFFKGVQNLYYQDLLKHFHDNFDTRITERAKVMIKEVIFREYEFYKWLKNRLFESMKIIYGEHNMYH